MLIAPGVHRFSFLTGGVEPIHLYLLEGTRGNILIDTGWNETGVWEKLTSEMREEGVDPAGISTIVLTHAHTDHVGLAARFKEVSGARLVVHKQEVPVLEMTFESRVDSVKGSVRRWLVENGLPSEDIEEVAQGYMSPWQFVLPPPKPDDQVETGDRLANGTFSLELFHSPGHSPGHICLFERSLGLLFTGDHLSRSRTFIGSGIFNAPNPWPGFLNSLDGLRSLPVMQVLPAHGRPAGEFNNMIDRQIERHSRRRGEVLDLLGGMPSSAYSVAQRMNWREIGAERFGNLTPGRRRRALAEVLAEIQALESEGKVVKTHSNGVASYAAACPELATATSEQS